MKKLLIFLLCISTISTHHITAMNNQESDLSQELYAIQHNPVAIRDTIIQHARSPKYEFSMLKNLDLPGAIQCRMLSDQLYRNDLDENLIKQLFNAGAHLNHYKSNKSQFVVAYWASQNSPQSIANTKQLLDLGADPDSGKILRTALHKKNSDKIKLILNYKPTKTYSLWKVALQEDKQHMLDLLVPNSTENELTNGLICYINKNEYLPTIMQLFITHGANKELALAHSINLLKTDRYPLNINTALIKNLKYLCDKQVFDETLLEALQKIANIFNLLVKEMSNKPQTKYMGDIKSTQIQMQQENFLHDKLSLFINALITEGRPLSQDSLFIQELTNLCKQCTHSTQALLKLKSISDIFNVLCDNLENNKFLKSKI